MLICYLYILFGELSVHIIHPFFIIGFSDVEKKHMDSKKGWGIDGMNWGIKIDIYTLLCMK